MRILLFKQQNTCYDSVNAMIDSMNAEFISRGIACDVIDVSQDREVVLAHMNIIEPNKYDAAIAINAVGQQNVTMGVRICLIYAIFHSLIFCLIILWNIMIT
jgi:hypothetical protein